MRAPVAWLVCVAVLCLCVQHANAAFVGGVSYFPHSACEPVLITLALESDVQIVAESELVVETPGLTAGACNGKAGKNVAKLLTSNAQWEIEFVEGTADRMFSDSYLHLTALADIAAGPFTIRIDPANGVKLTCYPQDSVNIYHASNPTTTWPLTIEPFGGCPVYHSELTFHPGRLYQPSEINVTLSLGMMINPGENITVTLPHFTSGSPFENDGVSVVDLDGFSLYFNATWVQEPGMDAPQLILVRTAGIPVPSASPAIMAVSRQNFIKPLRSSWTGDEKFSFAASGEYGYVAGLFSVVDSVGSGCEGLRGCSGHGVCDLESNTCICSTGFGAPTDIFEKDLPIDCSGKVCPAGVAGFATVPTSSRGGHPLRECSNNGVCDRYTGRCKCFVPFTGSACEIMRCPNECSKRGVCLTMRQLADHPRALPLRDNDGSTTYLPEVDGPTWDADVVTGCVCDSTWPVGLGAGETQSAEFFGADCSLRHCPSGDDPDTAEDETDCTGVVAEGGQGVGKPGNKCHVDCSNRGTCDFKTGVCKCFAGYWGENCGIKDVHAKS